MGATKYLRCCTIWHVMWDGDGDGENGKLLLILGCGTSRLDLRATATVVANVQYNGG